ncbi:MAG TPA: DUF4118 domain-containing protein, partial [Burkholderiaceae bacterium]
MRLLPPSSDRLRRWAIALGLAAGACALQWAVRPWFGSRAPFLFFLPAIVMAAMIGGRACGLLVVLAGFVSAALWLAPADASWLGDRVALVSLVVYLALGLLLAAVGARLRASSARARAAEQRLLLAGEDTGIG